MVKVISVESERMEKQSKKYACREHSPERTESAHTEDLDQTPAAGQSVGSRRDGAVITERAKPAQD